MELNLVRRTLFSNNSGSQMTQLRAQSGREYFLRVITFLSGTLWAESETDDEHYARSLGVALAEIAVAFESFEHPVSHRFINWDNEIQQCGRP